MKVTVDVCLGHVPDNVPSLEIMEVEHNIEFLVANDGCSVWLNIDGVCLVRISRISDRVHIVADRDGDSKMIMKSAI